MDDVSGLAGESKKFEIFLAVARKYRYSCVYIFHAIFSEKAIWRLILSQTNIDNIFPDKLRLPIMIKNLFKKDYKLKIQI